MKSLTAEQLQALRSYASAHGRAWKAALRDSWMTGRYDSDDAAPLLQQIRNGFGPTWLVNFSFRKVREIDGSDRLLADLKKEDPDFWRAMR